MFSEFVNNMFNTGATLFTDWHRSFKGNNYNPQPSFAVECGGTNRVADYNKDGSWSVAISFIGRTDTIGRINKCTKEDVLRIFQEPKIKDLGYVKQFGGWVDYRD